MASMWSKDSQFQHVVPNLHAKGLLGGGEEQEVLEDSGSAQDVFPQSKKGRTKDTGPSSPHAAFSH